MISEISSQQLTTSATGDSTCPELREIAAASAQRQSESNRGLRGWLASLKRALLSDGDYHDTEGAVRRLRQFTLEDDRKKAWR